MVDSVKSIHKDYVDFLNEYGFTQDFVDTILAMETLNDIDTMRRVELKESAIDGDGMFAIQNVEAGGYLAMARIDGVRALAGRYTNHSPTPNALFVIDDIGDLRMEALHNITNGEEVTINYRQAGEVNDTKR
jgi:SET domain